jgi:hypothetical protein
LKTRALLAALALAATTLQAQQSTLVGTWQLSYPVGAQIENGQVFILTGTGVLTVVAEGDSLIGTLVNDVTPDMPARPPARLAAVNAPGELVFVSHAPGKIEMNGEENDINVVSTWRLKATGDSIAGTVGRQIEGFEDAMQGPQPVTGSRKKP